MISSVLYQAGEGAGIHNESCLRHEFRKLIGLYGNGKEKYAVRWNCKFYCNCLILVKNTSAVKMDWQNICRYLLDASVLRLYCY